MDLKELIKTYCERVMSTTKSGSVAYEQTITALLKSFEGAVKNATINNSEHLSINIDIDDSSHGENGLTLVVELNVITGIITIKAENDGYKYELVFSTETKKIVCNQVCDVDHASHVSELSQKLMNVAADVIKSTSTSIENVQSDDEADDANDIVEELGETDTSAMFDMTD